MFCDDVLYKSTFYLPYILAYKLNNFSQFFALKVGVRLVWVSQFAHEEGDL